MPNPPPEPICGSEPTPDLTLDATREATAPEALVYKMDNNSENTELVTREYIVPVDAWTEGEPPMLFGTSISTLCCRGGSCHLDMEGQPFRAVRDPSPKVRLCPDGVPLFGE